jgi:hypothetical protein
VDPDTIAELKHQRKKISRTIDVLLGHKSVAKALLEKARKRQGSEDATPLVTGDETTQGRRAVEEVVQ